MVEKALASFEASETVVLTGTGTVAFDELRKLRGARSVRFLLPAGDTALTAIIATTLATPRTLADADFITLMLRLDDATSAAHFALSGTLTVDLRDDTGTVSTFTGAVDTLPSGRWERLALPLSRFSAGDLSSVRQVRVTITGSALGKDCAGWLDYISATWLAKDKGDME